MSESNKRRLRHPTLAAAPYRPVHIVAGLKAMRTMKDRARFECSPVSSIQILQAPLSRRPSLPRVTGDGQTKQLVSAEFTFNSKGVVLPCIHAPFRPGQRLLHRDNSMATHPRRVDRKTRVTFSDVDFDSPMPGSSLARRRLLAWAKTPKHINRQVYREMVRQHCFITLRHYDTFARGAPGGGKTKHLRRAATLAKVDIPLPVLWQDVGDNSEREEQVIEELLPELVVNQTPQQEVTSEPTQDKVVDEEDQAIKDQSLTPLPAVSETPEQSKQQHHHHRQKYIFNSCRDGEREQQEQQDQQRRAADVLSRYEDTPGLRTRSNKSGRALGNVVSLRQLRHMLLATPRPFKLHNCHNYYPE